MLRLTNAVDRVGVLSNPDLRRELAACAVDDLEQLPRTELVRIARMSGIDGVLALDSKRVVLGRIRDRLTGGPL